MLKCAKGKGGKAGEKNIRVGVVYGDNSGGGGKLTSVSTLATCLVTLVESEVLATLIRVSRSISFFVTFTLSNTWRDT